MSVFLKAAELLREKGWTRGKFQRDDGSMCVMGALEMAQYGNISSFTCAATVQLSEQYDLLHKIARNLGGKTAAHYNDKVAKSVDDVIALLELAHKEWEATNVSVE